MAAEVRLAEVMAALSLATDLAMGRPLEHALATCILGVRLGEAFGLSEAELRDVYYQALLRYIGCNAETHLLASVVGDEIALRTDFARIDPGQPTEVLGLMIRYMRMAHEGASSLQMAAHVARGLLAMPQIQGSFAGHCEVAQRLATRLGFGDGVVRSLGQLYERWDGRGLPSGLKAENISVAVRVVTLAEDAVTFHRLGGLDAAVALARKRAGAAYDPRLCEVFCRDASRHFGCLEDEPSWDRVLATEPGDRPRLLDSQFEAACQAMADFVDIKSSFTIGHSTGVSALAAEAARRAGLPQDDARALGLAGLLHDLGRAAVSASIWDKPGPLSERDWEKVRMHPYHTERILARPEALARLGTLASHHHERQDGSGYHRGTKGASPAARLLAAADVYQAMGEPRPHRPALSADEAAEKLRGEARSGRLDGEAVNCVLGAAGHRASRRPPLTGGLTEREVEVLRLLARGGSIKQIAETLVIAPKTVDNHVQHIYGKIGVSTRAGAALFAMENGLIDK